MNNFLREKLGVVLKEIRTTELQPVLTQQQMAEHLGLTVTAFSDYERCKTLPPLDRLYEITKVYGVSIQEMVDRARIKFEVQEARKRKANAAKSARNARRRRSRRA